jgi:hypothetical protein
VLPVVPLSTCLERWAAAEPLEDYYSAAAGGKGPASRTSRFTSFPPYLVVALKRWVVGCLEMWVACIAAAVFTGMWVWPLIKGPGGWSVVLEVIMEGSAMTTGHSPLPLALSQDHLATPGAVPPARPPPGDMCEAGCATWGTNCDSPQQPGRRGRGGDGT